MPDQWPTLEADGCGERESARTGRHLDFEFEHTLAGGIPLMQSGFDLSQGIWDELAFYVNGDVCGSTRRTLMSSHLSPEQTPHRSAAQSIGDDRGHVGGRRPHRDDVAGTKMISPRPILISRLNPGILASRRMQQGSFPSGH
jgi:hypothetical protein